MSDLEHNLTEDEIAESYKKISAKYTKQELVEKTLQSFEKLGGILHLVALALPVTEGMSAVQRTLHETAKAKEIRAGAVTELQAYVAAYTGSIAEAKEKVDGRA